MALVNFNYNSPITVPASGVAAAEAEPGFIPVSQYQHRLLTSVGEIGKIHGTRVIQEPADPVDPVMRERQAQISAILRNTVMRKDGMEQLQAECGIIGHVTVNSAAWNDDYAMESVCKFCGARK